MIILFTAGQLGNQIFQYSFVDNIKNENEKIVTSKCEYFDIFEYEKSEYVFLNKYSRYIVRRVLKVLAKLRLISSIYQNKEVVDKHIVDADSYTYKKGLFSFVKIVDGFYQSEKFVGSMPKIDKKYIEKATNYLSDIPETFQKVFVHIRRGDYLEWQILGHKNPSLPLSYYKEAIIQLQKELENPFFIFLSNDSSYVDREFDYVQNKKISKNDVATDIATMQLCDSAIVSNSTLSWWGVNLMDNKSKIIGPKYWLGWQSSIWYPKGIKVDAVKYINIGKEEI